ncbi:MAG: glycosyltransferase family 4 protein [Bacteroidota bacterium]
MKVVFSHPTGNANVRAASLGLMKAGLLSEFHTTIACFPGSVIDQIGSLGPLKELRRRSYDPLLKPVTKMHPLLEMSRMIALRMDLSSLTKHEKGIFSIDAVYNDLDRVVASAIRSKSINGFEAVYAYEDGALQSFIQAKKSGIKKLYDLPIGYWRMAKQLLEIERDVWPEWAATLSGLEDSEQKLQKKDEELSLADQIFVASTFTATTLHAYPAALAPVKVIPYGFPTVVTNRNYSPINNKPLKILFVGGLSQRKGIANLFTAIDKIEKHVQLTLVGKKPDNDCPALNKALAKHNWISSLPHQDILKLMRENDVLIFPSLFEGFGLVITEAMSQGTPVITTERTCGPDLIEHGRNGWLIEAGSTGQLQQAIENLLENPELIELTGRAALQTAANRPWHLYGEELVASIKQVQ